MTSSSSLTSDRYLHCTSYSLSGWVWSMHNWGGWPHLQQGLFLGTCTSRGPREGGRGFVGYGQGEALTNKHRMRDLLQAGHRGNDGCPHWNDGLEGGRSGDFLSSLRERERERGMEGETWKALAMSGPARYTPSM